MRLVRGKTGQRASGRQIAAYIETSCCCLQLESDTITAKLTFTNTGETPAHDVAFRFLTPLPEEERDAGYWDRLDSEPRRHISSVIEANSTCEQTIRLEGARTGFMPVRIVGRLTYRDAFGKDWNSKFSHVCLARGTKVA